MKKYIAVVAIAVLSMMVVSHADAVTDRTVSVTATASVAGATSMSISPTSAVYSTTTADAFATVPTGGKITITYASNYNPWKMAISTNNTQVPNAGSTDGRYAKGGLATTNGKNVVACKWVAQAPATAAPAVPTAATYNFVKDKRDQDDPATPTDNESWASSFAEGYANIAYGGTTGGVCVNPTKPGNNGDAVTGSIALYVAGMFGTGGVTPAVPAAAGSYSSAITIELYHE